MVEYKKQGIDLYVADTAIIKHPNEILLGNHVAIDHFVYISTRANIGDYVHIAPNTTILGGKDSYLFMEHFSGISANCTILCGSDDFTKGMTNPQVPIKYRNPKIGNVVLKRFSILGANCTIMPNVVLAEGSVVGANSVITKDTEPWTVYVGSPAKPIKKRNKESILEPASKMGYKK
jgi:acetyltransferase-like isoleucine patch superfamily enzyme